MRRVKSLLRAYMDGMVCDGSDVQLKAARKMFRLGSRWGRGEGARPCLHSTCRVTTQQRVLVRSSCLDCTETAISTKEKECTGE